MTATRAGTATGPSALGVGRAVRGPLLVAGALVVTGVLVAAYAATSGTDPLDPASYRPQGAHAIAALLRNNGVTVERVETATAVSARPDSTVFVPVAAALSPTELAALTRLPDRLVVAGATGPLLSAVAPGALDSGTAPVDVRVPACALPAAVTAGDVDLGGVTYRVPAGGTGCYATGGDATLLELPAAKVTLLGSTDLLTNERVAQRGNAALALALLGSGRDVQWLLPRPGARTGPASASLTDLLPRGLKLAALQLLIAVALLALWRARRLGGPVIEPLPVVVRASEAVEGRSRLYRAARARSTAAEALRSGARSAMAARLGLGPEVGPQALLAAVTARVSAPAGAVEGLLYGAAPSTDAALVALADDLTTLTEEVAAT